MFPRMYNITNSMEHNPWEDSHLASQSGSSLVFIKPERLHFSVRNFTFNFTLFYEWSRGSSGSMVSDYGLDDQGSIPRQRQRIFLLASAFRPALGPTQPPIQWVPGVLSPGVKRGWGVTLTTHPRLVPRLKMSRSYTSSPPRRLHGV
jgi:hypothetical protein